MIEEAKHDVAIVLVGKDSREYVKKCLVSLREAQWGSFDYEVIYVDNGSKDGTLDMIAEGFPEVETIGNDDNLGFCKAANQGAEKANSRYLCFLNDDTIVLEDAVARLARFLDEQKGAGAVGSRLLYPDMSEQWSGRRFPSPWNGIFGRRSVLSRFFPNAGFLVRYLYKDELKGERPFVVDWISAAAMMVRTEVYWAAGGCAEDYYYWHEAVLCDRIRSAGFEVFLDPLSRIIHFEGKGSGSRPYPIQRWHIRDFHEGAYRCYCEHHRLGKWSPWRLFAAVTLKTRATLLLAGAWLSSRLEKKPEQDLTWTRPKGALQ